MQELGQPFQEADCSSVMLPGDATAIQTFAAETMLELAARIDHLKQIRLIIWTMVEVVSL